MAKAVDELATATPGKKAIAIEAFARALRQVITSTYASSEIFFYSFLRSLPTMRVTTVLTWWRSCVQLTTKESRRMAWVSQHAR